MCPRPSPSDERNHRSDDLFRARLDQIILSDHLLVRLANAMPWGAIAEAGANAVKLQTYTADTMTLDSDREDFQLREGPWPGHTPL